MSKEICVKCKDKNCIGFVLLHPKELDKVPEIKKRELIINQNTKFKLIRSTNKDGKPDYLYTKFMELHVLRGD